MAYSNIKMSDIAVVSSTLHDLSGVVNDLSGVVNDLSGVVNDLSVTPVSNPLPEFTLTADQNINGAANTTFVFEDVNEGASATTVYSQGITHTNNTNIFTVSTAGQYLISYFLREDEGSSSNSARLYGYTCIRKEASNGSKIYEYTNGGEYLRAGPTPDDLVLSATTSITFNAGEKFKIRYYRLYNQNTDDAIMRKTLSNLRIERINYTAT